MEAVAQLKHRFLGMPWLLRIMVGACLGIGIIFPVLPFLPGSTFVLGESVLTVEEMWETRVSLALFAVGPLMVVVGVAIFLRHAWVRYVLVVLPLFQILPFLIVHLLYDAPNPASSAAQFAGSCVVWAILTIAYLFFYPGAKEHFTNAV